MLYVSEGKSKNKSVNNLCKEISKYYIVHWNFNKGNYYVKYNKIYYKVYFTKTSCGYESLVKI